MKEIDEFRKVVEKLRAKDGCPWDSVQTLGSLKACLVEEAAEVVCGVNIYEQAGNGDNLKEELGDLLFLIMLMSQIASEEGLFELEDVVNGISEKMIRRHPKVFECSKPEELKEQIKTWAEIKASEKEKKKLKEEVYLKPAMLETKELVDRAMARKDL